VQDDLCKSQTLCVKYFRSKGKRSYNNSKSQTVYW